jgi:hypothetical protein
MTILPLSVFFQNYAANVPWLVAATPQALPTGERPFNQRFQLDKSEDGWVPLCGIIRVSLNSHECESMFVVPLKVSWEFRRKCASNVFVIFSIF